MTTPISLLDVVAQLKAEGMRCNCDFDNWEPERDTKHSWVCRIHKAAKARMSGSRAATEPTTPKEPPTDD